MATEQSLAGDLMRFTLDHWSCWHKQNSARLHENVPFYSTWDVQSAKVVSIVDPICILVAVVRIKQDMRNW